MKKIFVICSFMFMAACTMGSPTAIRPENLINSSEEKISFPISDADSLTPIQNWISGGDTPTEAEISCADTNSACSSLKNYLSDRRIQFKMQPSTNTETGSVSLLYNRLVAHTCNPVHFGCSTSINAIRMVTNREQFTKPVLSDFQDAASAVKAISEVK